MLRHLGCFWSMMVTSTSSGVLLGRPFSVAAFLSSLCRVFFRTPICWTKPVWPASASGRRVPSERFGQYLPHSKGCSSCRQILFFSHISAKSLDSILSLVINVIISAATVIGVPVVATTTSISNWTQSMIELFMKDLSSKTWSHWWGKTDPYVGWRGEGDIAGGEGELRGEGGEGAAVSWTIFVSSTFSSPSSSSPSSSSSSSSSPSSSSSAPPSPSSSATLSTA